MALFSGDGWLFLLRWFHFLAGITWIGILYYFNFVQTPFFGSKFVADNAAVRSGIVRGGLLGTTMWANVWFVIWPGQQVVMASAEQVATGGQAIPAAAARGARAGIASRTNTMLSIPMLFFMGAASHLVIFQSVTPSAKVGTLVLLLIV